MKADGEVKIAYFDNSGRDDKRRWWQDCLSERLGPCQLIPLEDSAALGCEFALVWYPPQGRLVQLKDLKLIVSLGQGVDHLMADKSLPDGPAITRLVDPDMSHALSQWVLLNVLDYLRDGRHYRENAKERRFEPRDQRQTKNLPIAVYGMGAIGLVIAQRLAAIGFDVSGWSRSERNFPEPIKSVYGKAGFDALLASCDIHICILPLTPSTTNLFDATAFARMKKGAYFMNGGRGKQVVEADLLAALRVQHLDGACLDVFAEEPLPPHHPFWQEPAITIWPHVAAQTNPDTAADQVAAAIRAAAEGAPLSNLVDKGRGY
jgi:glyoxylate/hydroxypyruvate reductase